MKLIFLIKRSFDLKAKDVNINLVSIQSDGTERQSTELFSKGSYFKENGEFVISYEESEATGFEGSVTTLRVCDDKKVVMERKGEVNSQLIIEKDKKHFCRYGTPYGDFTIGVNASEIKSCLDENGGTLRFSYVLDINASYLGDFEIEIEVKSC